MADLPRMTTRELKEFLDVKAEQYETTDFIPYDPIQIPHRFTDPSDIAIAGFLSATIAWGNRKSIIKSADRMMEIMDHAPSDFIRNFESSDLASIERFVHRTFNVQDLEQFFISLQFLEEHHGGLSHFFSRRFAETQNLQQTISLFKTEFFKPIKFTRSRKHVSDPLKNSSAKRLNMFLRWMVRSNSKGVDFGIWNEIPASALSLPLDVHTGRVARKLNLLSRKQNDAKAVAIVDEALRKLDAEDPVKYDFALFGLGAHEDF